MKFRVLGMQELINVITFHNLHMQCTRIGEVNSQWIKGATVANHTNVRMTKIIIL